MAALFSILAGVCVMFVSLSGVIFTSNRFGHWMKSRITYLATFSAGVLSVLAYHLIGEAFEGATSLPVVAACIVIGVVALEIVHGFIPDSHHHHEEANHSHSHVDGRRVLLSDAVHNITDGFLIVSAFLADWRIGVGATVGIMLHELVQEISEFFVLKHAGYTDRQALTYNFLSSSTVLVGIAISLIFATTGGTVSILAALAAGGFLSVVIRDLIPHAIESARAKGKWMPHLAAVLIGATVMLAITAAIPEHSEEHATLPSVAQYA